MRMLYELFFDDVAVPERQDEVDSPQEIEIVGRYSAAHGWCDDEIEQCYHRQNGYHLLV